MCLNPKNTRFAELVLLCKKHFGKPRISGSHYIFKNPWSGDPRLNLQKDGNMAKPYQGKAVIKAIDRYEAECAGKPKHGEV
jgi:hypothetical protein